MDRPTTSAANAVAGAGVRACPCMSPKWVAGNTTREAAASTARCCRRGEASPHGTAQGGQTVPLAQGRGPSRRTTEPAQEHRGTAGASQCLRGTAPAGSHGAWYFDTLKPVRYHVPWYLTGPGADRFAVHPQRSADSPPSRRTRLHPRAVAPATGTGTRPTGSGSSSPTSPPATGS